METEPESHQESLGIVSGNYPIPPILPIFQRAFAKRGVYTMKNRSDTRRKSALSLPFNLSDYLTVRQAAEFLGISKATLRRWDSEEKLIAFRHPLNRYRLYRVSDLRNLLSKITQKKPVGE